MGFFSQLSLPFAFYIILFLSSHCLLLHVSTSSTTLSITTDTEALISFKSQLSNDPPHHHPSLSSWIHNSSSSPCNWTGVVCNNLGQRVIGLNLSGLRLSGQLSPHIGNLSFLESLQLQNNQFTGVIPEQIGNLGRLRTLNMSFNRLEGTIPPNITRLAELVALDLSSNEIVGRIPRDIGTFTKLQVLKLGSNNLYGTIPPGLGNISSLTNISFGTNTLSGGIPSELGRLKNLIELDLIINNLNGIVPPSIYNLSSLVNFAIASNNLWGEIPKDIGQKLPKLIIFNICFNKFRGKIPESLHNITNIQIIRMAYNLLEGSVPLGLGNLPFLHMYNIGYNKIDVSEGRGLDFIITSLTNSTLLNYLAIDGNRLEGVIPETIGNLSKVLSKLYMGENHFHGNIPTSLGNLSGLSLLNLSHNDISGEIPFELSQLEGLQELSLDGNKISGSIPNSLGSGLQRLNHLDLSSNELVGEIPSSFGNFQNLVFMDISNNKLNGSIPREVLNLPTLSNVLNVSKNRLSGSLPEKVGSLIGVSTLDFSDNLLSGEIPASISNCLSLENLFLARNSLSGSIPKELGDIKGLETLDLSSNQLFGSIPIELQNLNALQILNLSYNDLEGAIPNGGVFQNISALHLEGTMKLCLLSTCGTQEGGRKMFIIYIIIAIVITLILCFTIGFLLYVKSRKTRVAASSEMLKPHHPMVSYDELRRATENFDQENLLGTGSFGSVYKGHLSQWNSSAVAIKVLDTLRTGSLKSFFVECEVLKHTRHRNLVKLITTCSSIDFKNNEFLALVYEFLCNGSLEDWIKGKRRHGNGSGLDLVERLNIAIDIACALDYLHNDNETPIVHCDLKPSNILLGEDMIAKVGDFGLARLLVDRPTIDEVSISSTHVLRGSIGYIPPEYGWGEKASFAGDVYSFGTVLLELFSGKSPTDDIFTGGLSLTTWVKSAVPNKIVQVIDPQILLSHCNDLDAKGPNHQFDCVIAILEVGLSCTTDSPDVCLNMIEVLENYKQLEANF